MHLMNMSSMAMTLIVTPTMTLPYMFLPILNKSSTTMSLMVVPKMSVP